MNTINFARLISHIAVFAGKPLTNHQVEDMQQLVNECNSDSKSNSVYDVAELTRVLITSMSVNRKIDAIKAYRMLTGEALKESKDAIERVMDKTNIA